MTEFRAQGGRVDTDGCQSAHMPGDPGMGGGRTQGGPRHKELGRSYGQGRVLLQVTGFFLYLNMVEGAIELSQISSMNMIT